MANPKVQQQPREKSGKNKGQWVPDQSGKNAPEAVQETLDFGSAKIDTEETVKTSEEEISELHNGFLQEVEEHVTDATESEEEDEPTEEELEELHAEFTEDIKEYSSPTESGLVLDELNEALTRTLPDGTLHSEDDEPAFMGKDGTDKWYDHGKLHRDGGPAVTTINGSEEWCQYDVLHREGGPAVRISPVETKGSHWHEEWRINGVLDRKKGPALQLSDGTQMWYRKGKLKRWWGPAIIHGDGRKEWVGVGKLLKYTAIGFVAIKILKDFGLRR